MNAAQKERLQNNERIDFWKQIYEYVHVLSNEYCPETNQDGCVRSLFRAHRKAMLICFQRICPFVPGACKEPRSFLFFIAQCSWFWLISRTPQRSCRAAHGAKHLPLCAAAIRRRRLSQWGIETRHWDEQDIDLSPAYRSGGLPHWDKQFIQGPLALSPRAAVLINFLHFRLKI